MHLSRSGLRRKGANLHIYPTDMNNESRILRETAAIEAAGFFEQVVLVGRATAGSPVGTVRLSAQRCVELHSSEAGLCRQVPAVGLLLWMVDVWTAWRRRPVACVNAHRWTVLPLSALLAWHHQAWLVYDTHELETHTNGASWLQRCMARAAEGLFIRRASLVIVVNRPIADWYARTYPGITPTVVRNLPDRSEHTVPSGELRAAIGAEPDDLVFLYQGMLSPGRGIPLLVAAAQRLPPDRHLVLLGYGSLFEGLHEAAAEIPQLHLLPAVPPNDLLRLTAEADAGLCMIENTCLSYYLCLPNKLFEYLACGVPVLASDFPALRETLEETDSGWLRHPDADQVADFLLTVSPDALDAAKRRAKVHQTAFTWDNEAPRMISAYVESLGGNWE